MNKPIRKTIIRGPYLSKAQPPKKDIRAPSSIRMEKTAEVVALVKELHSYENPEVLALPVIGGSSQYLDWIDKEVRK